MGGTLVTRNQISIDHRYADGWHISQLIKPFKAYLQDPAAYEPAPERGKETPAVEPREAAGSAG